MLESIVASLLNRVLGSYVKNFDPKQLNIGIWGGDVKLKNLELKQEALDKFRLPLNVLEGHLGELVLQIPWSNLKNEPVKVEINDVFLLAEPRLDEEYDPEEESRREQDLKKERLERLELLEKNTPSAGLSQEEIQKNQSFTESLITKTIENLQITIRNIHIRYEDSSSVPGHPYSLGFTLKELSAVSTDENWSPVFVQNVAQVTRKLSKLSSLSIYWNTDSKSIRKRVKGEGEDGEDGEENMLEIFKSMIDQQEKAELNQYILKPVSGVGRITLNKTMSSSQPKSKVQLIFDELGFTFDSDQYRDALWTADIFRLYMNTKDFKRFRPKASVKEDPRAWCEYAANTVRNQIHEKRKRWSWDYIDRRLKERKEYIELYKIRCKNNPEGTINDSEKLARFKQLEFDLTYEDIKFYRSLAKAEIRKERQKEKLDEKSIVKATADAVNTASSWTSWIWGSNNAANTQTTDSVTMTEEQKKELYDAIEWDEKTAIEKSIEIPKDQIILEVETALESGSFTLRNDPHDNPHDVAAIFFNGFKAKFLQRPTSFLTNISLKEFRVDDKSDGTVFEQIVTVKPLSHEEEHVNHNHDDFDYGDSDSSSEEEENSNDAFFWLSFENNPLNQSADSSLYIKTKSITIFYNARFIENIARFFTPPKTHLETIGAIINAAGATVEGIRNQTRLGLEYALQEHKTINVKLDLQAPLIVLPLDVASWNSPCAIIDAGHISVISELAPAELLEEIKKKQSHQYQEKDWENLESLMYDKFKLQLHDTQILIGTSVRETMKQLHRQETNPCYVIGRINMDFLVEISILPNAYNLTKFKVTGHLPTFRASMSDSKYKLMMQLIDKSIPNFNFDEIEIQSSPDLLGVGMGEGMGDDELIYESGSNEVSRNTSSTDLTTTTSATTTSSVGPTSETQNIFLFTFKVDKVELSLHKCINEQTLEQNPLVDMVLEQFELEYIFRSLEMTADVTLRSLHIEDYTDTKCPLELRQIVSSTSSVEGKNDLERSDLFNVKYKRVKLPVIKETGEEPSDQIVEVSMSTIRFVIEPKTFLTLLDFIITTFTTPEQGGGQIEARNGEEGGGNENENENEESSIITPTAAGSIDVRVNLKSVILILNDEGVKLATLKLDSALVSVVLLGETMDIKSKIGSLSLQDDYDLNNEQIISIEGDELADFKYETFDRKRTDISYNSSIYFRLGSLKVNLIEKPLTRILSFFSRLNEMKGLFDRARQLAMNQANQMENADKIRFDVVIKTPIFVFPNHNDSLTAHLGEIYLQNKFEPIEGVDAVINNTSAGIRDMKLISKFHFDSFVQDLQIIDKIDIAFDISYVSEYEGINRPTLIINGGMSDIKLKLTERQFQYLMNVLRTVPAIFSDIGLDDEEVDELSEELRQSKRIETISTDISTDEPNNKPATVDKLDLNFNVKTVSLTLYNSTHDVKPEDINKHSLSHFSLNDSGIKLLIKKDNTLESDIHIHSFTVSDTRKIKENKFPDIIPSVDYGEYQFMCKVNQYDNRYDVLLTVDSPQMILALDYLFALKGFIDFGLTNDEEPKVVVVIDEEPEDTPATTQSSFSIGYHINVVDFSVILLADPSSPNSEALVFKAEQLVLSERDTTTLSVSKVGMFLCEMSHFNEGRLRVLDDFSMTATIDTRGSDAIHQLSSIQIAIEPLVLRLSLRDVLLVLNIIQKASALSENEIKELETDNGPKYSRFSKTEKRKLAGSRKSSVVSTRPRRRSSVGARRKSLPEIKVVRGEELTGDFEGLRLVVIGVAHELPVLDMCVKPFSVNARSWSSDLRIDMAAESFVNVFNPSKSAWEPLIETWDFGFNMSRSNDLNNTFVNIYSRKPIEMTLTSQTIELLTKSADFVSTNSADEDFLLKPRNADAPYVIRNETGYDIDIWSDFEISEGITTENKKEKIKDGEEIPWRFYDWHVVRENLSTDLQNVSLGVGLRDSPYDSVRSISVTSEGEHLHILYRGSKRTGHRLLCEVILENYRKKIIFRSALNVKNSTHININIRVKSDRNLKWILHPDESRSIPISLVHECQLEIMPDKQLGFDWSDGIYWKSLLDGAGSLSCKPVQQPQQVSRKTDLTSPFYFHVEAEFDKSLPITWAYPYMRINFCAPIEIVNLLPYDIEFRIFNRTVHKDWRTSLKKGDKSPVHVVKRSDLLLLSVQPKEAGYEYSKFAVINAPKGGFKRERVMTTHSSDGTQKLNLNIHYFRRDAGSGFHIVVYTPYLILNKTGLDLQISTGHVKAISKVTSIASLIEGEDNNQSLKRALPKMWSFENDEPGNRAAIKVGDSKWSSDQSFDAIGSSCQVNIPGNDHNSQISVGMHVSEGQGKYKLTKLVTIAPRYVISNKLNEDIQFKEEGAPEEFTVKSKELQPVHFLRKNSDNQELCVRLAGRKSQWSAPFIISNTGRTYVKILKHGKGTILLKIDTLLEQSTLFLYFEEAGNNWPYSIRNFSNFEFLFYQANPYIDNQGVEQHPHPPFVPIRYKLPAKSVMSYAWDYPAAALKELVISCNGKERRVQLAEIGNLQPMKIPRTDVSDGGIIELHVVADGPLQSLVISDYDPASSLYKLRNQSSLSAGAPSSSQVDLLFSVDDSSDNQSVFTVTLQLEGVGISLINRRHIELCYMTLRGFEVKYRSSELYETVSMKMKWIQIDNQLNGGHYEVVLFPSVLPKSTREMENHPTLSAMVTRVKDESHGVVYIKYATILLQEITLEIDEDFLFSLLEFARDPHASWTGSEKDILCDETLLIPQPENDSSGMDIYIEVLHIQPAQIDLSFVRTERINVEDKSSSPNALNYFVNILTMAIGNINDAPVKLNALLMENVRTPIPILMQSIQSHYSQGFLYQVHKILGSADFIGNPVGLFNNISSGFVDMFYEPYNGFMLNDRLDELGIGIAKGGFSFMKKSIFGISDSVYKITGSVSKGLSVATLDRDFQNRRRMNMARNKPKHALYGITQGATSLFDGVTSGISGLALAPMEGAAKEGTAGFLKGLGKGFIGLPTKTAIGFFDLASNFSEGVRNTTTVFDGETITRIRPPRFIARDGIVRPYSQREAIGQQWLKGADSGKFFKDEYLAHVNMTRDDAVVIVTTTRIITLFTSKMKSDWEVKFDELKSINRRTTGLTLILKDDSEKGSFFIPIADEDSQRFLYKEISLAVTEYNRRLQTIS